MAKFNIETKYEIGQYVFIRNPHRACQNKVETNVLRTQVQNVRIEIYQEGPIALYCLGEPKWSYEDQIIGSTVEELTEWIKKTWAGFP